MARIRHIEIKNFRSIQSLDWAPLDGINCLIGPGDSGKSSIIDAIDLCLCPRRTAQFCDADFYKMQVDNPISITVTLGQLDDSLKNIETYGDYLRSYSDLADVIEDEPSAGLETVLTFSLTVAADLEPMWALKSDRALAQGKTRSLTWSDKSRIAPTRIGTNAEYNLAWRRGSILNHLSDEQADTSAALANAARQARVAFGQAADPQLRQTLNVVQETAAELGVPVGQNLKAMLDAHSVSFSGGTIALHEESGVPIRNLGVGSIRLLVAGLQRKAEHDSSIVLIDELEYGLEPHRILKFLSSLGAKEASLPLQVFAATHSPVVLRELSGAQLFVVRKSTNQHYVHVVGTANDIQGTIRTFPDAFLATSVITCEGATEVGLMRGLDQYRVQTGRHSLTARGVALVDAGGVTKIYSRANAFQKLEYRGCVLRDDDRQPDSTTEAVFIKNGGAVFHWGSGNALEDALFELLPDATILALIDRAIEIHEIELIEANVLSASNGEVSLQDCRTSLNVSNRQILAKAASAKDGWFKRVTWMEDSARDIIGPSLSIGGNGFVSLISRVFDWIDNAPTNQSA